MSLMLLSPGKTGEKPVLELMTHRELGNEHTKFGLAHSESQLIGSQIHKVSNASPSALSRLSVSG